MALLKSINNKASLMQCAATAKDAVCKLRMAVRSRSVLTVLVLPVLLAAGAQNAGAQVTGNKYSTSVTYNNRTYNNLQNVEIRHKKANWFKQRETLSEAVKNNDSFSDEVEMFDFGLASGAKIQAAHTYIDTIYVHKGSSVRLYIPDISGENGGGNAVLAYQRWYSYRTRSTFETNQTGTNAVRDLLTPDIGNSTDIYRLANGYVGNPLRNPKATTSEDAGGIRCMDFYYPTNSQFASWFPNSNADNDWFVVACDVSGYNDYCTADEYDKGETAYGFLRYNSGSPYAIEPTLTHRIIFYIVGVDNRGTDKTEEQKAAWDNGHGRLTTSAYQGGGNGSDKKYLEEYEITFPSKHLSNKTDELVALTKDARSYAIPGVSRGDDSNILNISIANNDNSAGISVVNENNRLSERHRVIKFRKSGTAENTPWKVDDGTTATILVTKTVDGTTYNIARYKLSFFDESVPLTQTQVSRLGTGSADTSPGNIPERSPAYMKEHYNLLTSLTWDYDPKVQTESGYGGTTFYPFPMAWDYSSYSFYDGSNRRNWPYNSTARPEWGAYSITSDYVGYGENVPEDKVTARPEEGLGKDVSTYHVYVDASDRPGTLARLSFKEKLCQGSEMFVTAWMKSAGEAKSDDAAVLFTILGVKTTDGKTTYTPIYRHSSSQIRMTTHLRAGDPGTGSNTNEWYQLYFSFINDNAAKIDEYDSYILQVDNNCASTSGGDFYLDDIKVFLMQPTAQITQKEYTCTSERTLMHMQIDWERLMSRLGNDPEMTDQGSRDGIDFCFIDETKYNNYIKAHPTEDTDLNAIKNSIVIMDAGDKGDNTSYNYEFSTFRFFLNFDSNKEYVKGTTNLAKDNMLQVGADPNNKRAHFYRSTDDNGNRTLAVDFYSMLEPNRPYIMLMRPSLLSESVPTADEFVGHMTDPCGIKTRFYVQSENVVKVNGEIIDPSTDYCVGQQFSFGVNVRVPVGVDEAGEQKYVVLTEGVYFDWFFGTEEEFHSTTHYDSDGNVRTGLDGVSLQAALTDFRANYPNADMVDSDATPVKEETSDGTTTYPAFTQKEFDLLKFYSEEKTGEYYGLSLPLVLRKENLGINILDNGLELVVQPIRTFLPPGGTGISEEQWTAVCWNYIPVLLNASGNAPTLKPGFNVVKYPDDDFMPNLRIGLNQIKALSDKKISLKVNLRDATFSTDEADRLGKISQENRDRIYLVGTDDPAYQDFFMDIENFDSYSLPIGKISDLQAERYSGGVSSYDDRMDILFDTETVTTVNGKEFRFNPREGFHYTFMVEFEEYSSTGSMGNTCWGKFNVDMLVVPEYLVWKGTDRTANWNNDANWKRADDDDLKITNAADYTDNDANGTDNGFVPMLFSKVVMPENSMAELYRAGYASGGDGWENTERPAGMGDPTENIQYDLMVYDNNNTYSTQRYRVNLCDEIHFSRGAQMMNSEQLLYNKAWMDVDVPAERWVLLATPLKGVVAGDWYTDKGAGTATGGSQADRRLFTDITFGGNATRIEPEVYQRSWNEGAQIINWENNTDHSAHVGTEWGTAYNDASVPYQPGTGFSVKTIDYNLSEARTEPYVFRLPKGDTGYSVSSHEIDRTGAGKLKSSDLLDRSDPYSPEFSDFSVQLTPSSDGKYMLLGNPFVAYLDMNKFFANEHNVEMLDKVYWTDGADGPVVAGADSNDRWVSADGTADALLPPNTGCFVKLKDGVTASKVEVTFTTGMQALEPEAEPMGENKFSIRAANAEGNGSNAAIAYGYKSSDGYRPGEDVVLMQDAAVLRAGTPLVYSVAGNNAVSVNRVDALKIIPLGVYADDGELVTLTFSNVASLLQPTLYDAATGSETPLTEGYTLELSGASHGRYFLCAEGSTTGITETETGLSDISVYSPVTDRLVVASGAGLRSVSVWSVGGALLKSEKPAGLSCTIDGIRDEVVIVKVNTDNGTRTVKLNVK